ncbi:MAG TPA: hypothetical protein VOA78_15335 [Candidatus Dormibacteraeota bacterium]|nr:hypothetical protein [Candidatus Dormibacteraeota bacterium]
MARGLTNQGAIHGGTIQQIVDCDSLQGPVIFLNGLADVINPHVSGNYVIRSSAADLMTLGAPTAGIDDNLSINIWSDAAFVHTITTVALFANGAALANVATFKAFKGSGVSLRAFNGVWQVLASNVTSIA